jgi:small ligand-binding sensory domain FIST
MQFINCLSKQTEIAGIVDELASQVQGHYDFGILFISHKNRAFIQELIQSLALRIQIKTLLGCSCAGIISTREEVEAQPATSLILANLPGVKIKPFALSNHQLENLMTTNDWYEFFEIYPNEHPNFLILPDPFSSEIPAFLQRLNQAYPQSPIVGGLASAAAQPKENSLIFNREIFDEGLVGVALTGDIRMRTIVSQGCKPIGETYIITKAEENVIYELAGQPLLTVLKKVLEGLSARDQLLAQQSLFVGMAMDEYKHTYKRGDFLIRGFWGIDPQSGAGIVGDYVKSGQTVQFHLRDAGAATEDLNELLTSNKFHEDKEKPKGALVFSCNGRGENLFQKKNHDIDIIQQHIGPVPAAGFFCAGEIGPIAGINHLHGFTDSIALFYPSSTTPSPN